MTVPFTHLRRVRMMASARSELAITWGARLGTGRAGIEQNGFVVGPDLLAFFEGLRRARAIWVPPTSNRGTGEATQLVLLNALDVRHQPISSASSLTSLHSS